MTPLHSILPELAAREVRCVHIGAGPDFAPGSGPPPDEYAYLEFYCEDLNCDCRRVFLEVVPKSQPGKVFASISYGWENEAFYRKRMPWNPNAAKRTVRGELDAINEQSEFAAGFLELFRKVVLDEEYRLRLQRHHQLFREALARRGAGGQGRRRRPPPATEDWSTP
jgi:hypothetical protein